MDDYYGNPLNDYTWADCDPVDTYDVGSEICDPVDGIDYGTPFTTDANNVYYCHNEYSTNGTFLCCLFSFTRKSI